MAFQRLAPHSGLTPIYGTSNLGINVMRGGFSWSALGSTLGNAFGHVGSFLGNTAQRIGNSQAFQQAKEGFLDSGIVNNVASLAGSTVNALVDIGKLKMEHDMAILRQKALGNPQPVPEPVRDPPVLSPPAAVPDYGDEFAQYLRWKQSLEGAPPAPPVIPVRRPPVPPLRRYAPPISSHRPLPLVPPSASPFPVPAPRRFAPPPPKRRKRGWDQVLDNITGSGIRYKTRRYCV